MQGAEGRDADTGQEYLADAWPGAQVLLEPQEGGFAWQGFHFGSAEREQSVAPTALCQRTHCSVPFSLPGHTHTQRGSMWSLKFSEM